MTDESGAVSRNPPKDAEAAAATGPAPKATLPPLSKDITSASATGTSATYTDYSLITADDGPGGDGTDDEIHTGSRHHKGGGGSSNNNQGETFPLKLHRILSRPDLSHVVSWLDHGRAWKVHNPELFASAVIPEYYNHSKYTSFSRQVNGWGFRRIGSGGRDHQSYYHELFLRGAPHLADYMRRPGPVPAAARQGMKKSKIGCRRRTTAASRENEPDFHALGEARPLSGGNPPTFVYPAEDAAATAAAAAGGGSAIVKKAKTKPGKKRMTSKPEADDIMKDAIGVPHRVCLTNSNIEEDDRLLFSKKTAQAQQEGRNRKMHKSSPSPDASHFVQNFAAATHVQQAEGDAGGANDDGGVGDITRDGMATLIDQHMKLVEIQQKVMAQVRRQGQTNAGLVVNWGRTAAGTTKEAHPASSMVLEPDPIRCDNDDGSTDVRKSRGRPGPSIPGSTLPSLDDFDQELDELAGFLGPVVDKTKSVGQDSAASRQKVVAAAVGSNLASTQVAIAQPNPFVPFPAVSGGMPMQKHSLPVAQTEARPPSQQAQLLYAMYSRYAGKYNNPMEGRQQQQLQLASPGGPVDAQDPRQLRQQMMMMMRQQHYQRMGTK